MAGMEVEIDKLRFSRSDRLGTGKFGCVFRGKFANVVTVAIKRMKKQLTELDSIIYNIVSHHSNIINYYYTNEDDDFDFLYLATELCAGTLYDLYNGKYKGPDVGDCRLVLRQITSGLQYLHSFKIAHGDLKPSNVLISIANDNSSPEMKLADFGLSHAVRNKDDTGYEENQFRPAFSKGWMCPFDAVDDDGKWPISFDVFPLGVLFAFAALKGVHPFVKDLKEARLKIKNRRPMPLNVREIDPNVRSTPFLQLLAKMVSYDPSQRPTSSEIIANPFFIKQPIMAPAREQHLENAPVVPSTSTARQVGRTEKKYSNDAGIQSTPIASPFSVRHTRSQSGLLSTATQSKHTYTESVGGRTSRPVSRLPSRQDRFPLTTAYVSAFAGRISDSTVRRLTTTNNKKTDVDQVKRSQVIRASSSSSEDEAREMVNSPKPFTCEICGHRSARKGDLKKHILTVHSQVKPFECHFCQKRFATKWHLSRHINTHTGAKPYKCDKCTHSYADPSSLLKHRKSHSAPSYKCEFCRRTFTLVDNLKRHRDGNKRGRITCEVRRRHLAKQKKN